jgi:hypothetical protein
MFEDGYGVFDIVEINTESSNCMRAAYGTVYLYYRGFLIQISPAFSKNVVSQIPQYYRYGSEQSSGRIPYRRATVYILYPYLISPCISPIDFLRYKIPFFGVIHVKL